MINNEKVHISIEVSKFLFLSNLIANNDDNIDDLIKELKTIVLKKANNKLHYLSSLDFKLKMIRYKSIIKEIEEEKAKNLN